MKGIIKNKILLILIVFLGVTSCSEDFLTHDSVEYASRDQINEKAEEGGKTVVTLMRSTMAGAYNAMIAYQGRHDAFSEMSVGLAGDLMTEDVAINFQHNFIFDYQLDFNAAAYARPQAVWNYLYSAISKCNEVIGQIPTSTDEAELKYVLGEALALRSYAYLRLSQRFQQTYVGNEDKPCVPLTLTTNDDRESVKSRATVREVYDKILLDMETAIKLLDGYTRANKTIINKNVAAGIYARALMVVGDWEKAAEYANIARNGGSLMTSDELKDHGFNDINNKEWIWGADITGENTSKFGSFFAHVCSYDPGYGESTLMPKMIDARLYSMIGVNDVRKLQFKSPTAPINPDSKETEENAPSYCNFKFKSVEGWMADYVYMRVSEMYLIEAEALAHQSGKGAEAYAVMKEYMDNRDPDWATNRTTVTPDDVFLQKRIELWAEGHILYDYLRLKKGINRDYSGSNHYEKLVVPAGSWKYIYQIPQAEMDDNPDLTSGDQNPLG